jgi:hypothetical protein
MRATDRPEFLKILNGLAAIKRVDLTPEALGMWWSAMADWSVEDFRSGANHLLKTCRFMPSPFDFEQLRKAGQGTAAEAWVRVVQQSPRWRSGEQGDADPLIDRCIRAVGGNEVIAMTPVADLHWLEKRFTAAYDELSDVAEARSALPDLTSAAEARRIADLLARGRMIDSQAEREA